MRSVFRQRASNRRRCSRSSRRLFRESRRKSKTSRPSTARPLLANVQSSRYRFCSGSLVLFRFFVRCFFLLCGWSLGVSQQLHLSRHHSDVSPLVAYYIISLDTATCGENSPQAVVGVLVFLVRLRVAVGLKFLGFLSVSAIKTNRIVFVVNAVILGLWWYA